MVHPENQYTVQRKARKREGKRSSKPKKDPDLDTLKNPFLGHSHLGVSRIENRSCETLFPNKSPIAVLPGPATIIAKPFPALESSSLCPASYPLICSTTCELCLSFAALFEEMPPTLSSIVVTPANGAIIARPPRSWWKRLASSSERSTDG